MEFVILFILTMLDIGAIIAVLLEDILYSKKEKLIKVLFILLVPFIGAVWVIWKIKKFYKKDNHSDDNPHSFTYNSGPNDWTTGGD